MNIKDLVTDGLDQMMIIGLIGIVTIVVSDGLQVRTIHMSLRMLYFRIQNGLDVKIIYDLKSMG